jgi:hypothetical protein
MMPDPSNDRNSARSFGTAPASVISRREPSELSHPAARSLSADDLPERRSATISLSVPKTLNSGVLVVKSAKEGV